MLFAVLLFVNAPADADDARWNAFVLSPQIFRDFSEADDFSLQMAEKARPYVENAANAARQAGSSSAIKRLGLRSLLVGAQLEYLTYLVSGSDSKRQASAARILNWKGMIERILESSSLKDLEEAQTEADWQRALLQLRVMEHEVRKDAPTVPSALDQMRSSLLTDLSTDPPPRSKCADLMHNISSRFRDARELATTAIAARVQASSVLGTIYGYPIRIEEWKEGPRDWPKLAEGEVNAFKPWQAEPNGWDKVRTVLADTVSGVPSQGITDRFSEAKQALALDSDLLSTFPSDRPPTPIVPEIMISAYALEPTEKSLLGADGPAVAVLAMINRIIDQRPPEITVDKTGPSNTPETIKLGPAHKPKVDQFDPNKTCADPNDPCDGGLAAFLEVLERRDSARGRASLELETLRRDVESAVKDTSIPPFQEYETLVDVVAMILQSTRADAEAQVQQWINAWFNQQFPSFATKDGAADK